MAKEVIVPKFGFTQEESQIVSWLVQEGDAVEAGDPLFEVTTDKVNMEVEAPATGVIRGIRANEGDIVPVTAVVAYIVDPDEALPSAPAGTAQTDQTDSPKPGHQATPVAARLAAAAGVDLAEVSGSGRGGRVTRSDVAGYLAGSRAPQTAANNGKVRATPAARQLAHRQGLDLSTITGSGPRGRIQSADVSRAAAPVCALVAAEPERAGTRIPFSTMRRTIARAMQRSVQEAPHVTFQADTDMTALEQLLAAAGQPAARLSLTAAIARATAWALTRNPLLNSTLAEDAIVLSPAVNIGIAVALDDGLLVPVIQAADRKGLTELSAEVRDLSARAREGRLRPEELSGATFTISNLGMFGIDRFTAIINPPQVGILAVGRTTKRIVPDANDLPVVRPVCTMTLAADHRVVDGAVAARFMADLRQAVESPAVMLL